MTETQTMLPDLPDLTITARADLDWNVTFEFDGFPAGNAATVIAKLVAHWQMTEEVATDVVNQLFYEVTSEDGWETATLTLTADPDGAAGF
jgi:hypothetical protein